MNKPALLPCPFCGSRKIRHLLWVQCEQCQAQAGSPVAWNQRAEAPSAPQETTPFHNLNTVWPNPDANPPAAQIPEDPDVQRMMRLLQLRDALRNYVKAQSRMRDKWAEGDENVKRDLWRNLHACEKAGRAALDLIKPTSQVGEPDMPFAAKLAKDMRDGTATFVSPSEAAAQIPEGSPDPERLRLLEALHKVVYDSPHPIPCDCDLCRALDDIDHYDATRGKGDR